MSKESSAFAACQIGPEQLIRYINFAHKRGHIKIVGVHIAQLASLVNIVPVVKGELQQSLSLSFILPTEVENIEEILQEAKKAFPLHGYLV